VRAAAAVVPPRDVAAVVSPCAWPAAATVRLAAAIMAAARNRSNRIESRRQIRNEVVGVFDAD
jgi:hypothetical protein